MIRKFMAALAVFALFGCATNNYQTETDARRDAFMAAIQRSESLFDAGKLTRIEFLNERLAAAKTYYPQDGLLQQTMVHHIQLAEKLEKGEITQEKYNLLKGAAWDRFDAASAQRNAEAAAQNEAARQQAIGAIMMSRALQPPPQQQRSCISQMIGNQFVTDCR